MKFFKLLCISLLTLLVLPTGITYGQTISGQVRDEVSLFALPGIDIDVFEISNPSVNLGGGPTDSSGNYTVTLPGAGTYILRADPVSSDGVADEYYNNQLLKSLATQISVGSAQDVTGINLDLPRGVYLTGKVTSSISGLGLDIIDMDLYHLSGEFMGSYPATTLIDGSYSFGAVPPGTYFIAADPDPALGQLYLKTFYGGSNDILTAQPIVIGSANVVNLNIALSAGGSISGIVTESGTGIPLMGIDIDLFDSTGVRISANAVTDVTGAYNIGAVPSGDYIVLIDPTINQGYALSYYPSGLNQATAALVSVIAGQTTSGVNVALLPGGSLSGTITTTDSTPLANIDLDIFDSLGNRVDLTARTDDFGDYLLGPMPAGNYIVRADPTILQGYARTYYPNALNKTSADLIPVWEGTETFGVDFALENAGTISGVIRQASDNAVLSAVDLDCFDALGNRIDITSKSDLSGVYKIGPLPPGNYLLRADPVLLTGLAPQLYLNQIDVNFGTPITVSANTDTAGIDFSLVAAGSLSGLITNQNALAVPGIDLDLFDMTTGIRLRASAVSDGTGFYHFDQLTPGTYKVRVDPSIAQPYAMQYYTGMRTKTTANTVIVTANTTTANTNFTLAPGTSISGTITDILTDLPIQSMDIDVIVNGSLVVLDQSDKTAPDGTYTLHGLPLDSLLISADPSTSQFYRQTYYIGSATPASATPVSLLNTTPVSGINIGLPSASATLRDDFHTLDSNGDKRLTYAESLIGLPNLTNVEFNGIDINADGYLSIEEIIASSNSSGNNTTVWVDGSYTDNELGTLLNPFNTIEEGNAFVAFGGFLRILKGTYPETIRLDSSTQIESSNGVVSIGK